MSINDLHTAAMIASLIVSTALAFWNQRQLTAYRESLLLHWNELGLHDDSHLGVKGNWWWSAVNQCLRERRHLRLNNPEINRLADRAIVVGRWSAAAFLVFFVLLAALVFRSP